MTGIFFMLLSVTQLYIIIVIYRVIKYFCKTFPLYIACSLYDDIYIAFAQPVYQGF